MGQEAGARDALHQCLIFARAQGDAAWPARLRAARLLCDLGQFDEAEEALPGPDHLPHTPIDDPPAQGAALRARIQVSRGIPAGADLASWVISRRTPFLAIRGTQFMVDASKALKTVGRTEQARTAVKRALKAIHAAEGADGLRLELLLALHQASPDPRVNNTAGQVAQRILAQLSPRAAKPFSSRPEVADALSAIR